MWHVSGNRDETVIANPDAFVIGRERPRHHLSFGFGIHHCVGNRPEEMQLCIVWEEILKRFPEIEVVEEPVSLESGFVRTSKVMQVVIPKRTRKHASARLAVILFLRALPHLSVRK